MSSKTTFSLGILFLVILIVISSMFTVMQGRSALIARFGKLTTDDAGFSKVKGPGLHFKIPLVDNVIKFDMRLQTLDLQSSRIITTKAEGMIVNLIVDYYVKWKILDLPVYYTRTGGQLSRTQSLLRQQLNEVLKAEFGRRTVAEVVSDNRDIIMQAMNEKAKVVAKDIGVDVIDVRIRRIDLPDEVSANVYERMRADKERAAKELRAEGKALAEAIKAKADANVTVMIAKAYEKAGQLRAKGDAGAAKIYSDAYGQDPEFYSFYRSLLAYTNTLNSEQTLLVLTPDSQFFEYFNQNGLATGKTFINKKARP